ncbi:MAG: DUF362 domain-containing protein [Bacteroides sp.]|nr:DUF362 domain-containing protein [Bacteroides sp.]MCM1472047.1 DUF362 domain-containing protein [Bacteroides sp.]
MTREITPEALVRIYKAHGCPADGHRVAVKISTGEAGNPNYLSRDLISQLVDSVYGSIVECNTAYAGKRNTFDAHWQTVHEHGFDSIAPVYLLDEEGKMKIPVRDRRHIKYDIVGNHLPRYDYMINLSYFKDTLWADMAACSKMPASEWLQPMANPTCILTARLRP